MNNIKHEQEKANAYHRLAYSLLKLARTFLVLPYLIILFNYLIFTLPFDYQSITYLQALVTTIVISTVLKLKGPDGDKR